MNEAFTIDYAIDGADQVEQVSLNLIKGGGGAMLREKIVDSAARKLAIVVDETKLATTIRRQTISPIRNITSRLQVRTSADYTNGWQSKVARRLREGRSSHD